MLRRPARDLTRTFTRTFASSSSSAPRVSIERAADGVATVTLGRPEKLNSLDIDMFRAIRSAAVELAEDKGVRAVVVHGSGRAFCAGLDVKSINHPLHARANGRELLDRPDGAISNLAQDVCYLWRRVPAPVIAATHGAADAGGGGGTDAPRLLTATLVTRPCLGVCLGGGFQIALGAGRHDPLSLLLVFSLRRLPSQPASASPAPHPSPPPSSRPPPRPSSATATSLASLPATAASLGLRRRLPRRRRRHAHRDAGVQVLPDGGQVGHHP